MESAFIVFAVVCALYLAGWIWYWRRRRWESYWKKKEEEWERKEQERLRPWREKIAECRHLLIGKSWKDSTGKKEFVEALCGPEVPQYLWYCIGSLRNGDKNLLEEESFGQTILSTFFKGISPQPGDLEFHRSEHGIGTVLRVRNANAFVTEMIYEGRRFPLYQIGATDCFGLGQDGCVSFLSLYD